MGKSNAANWAARWVRPVPDRSQAGNVTPMEDMMKAKCGHSDMLGYLANTVCRKCAVKNHKKAMGK